MENKIQELGGEYIAEKIIERSKDTNIIYSTEDIVLNTNCVKQLAEYLESLLSRLKTAERMNDVLAEKLEEVAYEVDLDNIYSELYDCNGLDRNWNRGKEKEVEDIKKWARKKVEENV